MEMFNLHFMVLAALAVMGVLFSAEIDVVMGQAECKGDIPALIQQCAKYVQKGSPEPPQPSPECCTAIKTLDFPCVCKHVTSEIEKMIDMKKAVEVVRTCGVQVSPGTKCGSYTVPPFFMKT